MKPFISASLLLLTAPVIAGDYMAGEDQSPVINGCVLEPQTQCVDANLQGADLSNMDLRGANFKGADLSGANLNS